MKKKDLPIDRTKHMAYSGSAQRCVRRLLRMCYDTKTAEELWEKIQLKYAEFLVDEPALKDLRITSSIYDPILIFAWYSEAPKKPEFLDTQREICRAFFGSFDLMGKVFDLNRRADNRLAARIFQRACDIRIEEIGRFPASFRMGPFSYDRENGVIRYSFTQCPNAEFAKRHHMEDALPLMCNCDHLAMQKIHACLIREGTCVTSDRCDYCICGDRNPMAKEYRLTEADNGLMLSVKTEN